MNLAPIALFVFNRLDHTKQTIESLSKNFLANESLLYIFSDEGRNEKEKVEVEKVRNYLKTIKGFKEVFIISRKNNFGLAQSIILGVTKIINDYGKIIVLEDDLVTSPTFLRFMNNALDFYQKEKNIWHISGWNYPMNQINDDIFIWRGMECWGWATWKDRWQYFEKDSNKLIKEFSKKDIYKFNLDGKRNNWKQVILNNKGKLNTWAVFWYASIFKNKGLSINPTITFVKNIGLDGTGTNCTSNDIYSNSLNNKEKIIFYKSDKENIYYIEQIKDFSDKTRIPLYKKISNKFKKVFGVKA